MYVISIKMLFRKKLKKLINNLFLIKIIKNKIFENLG
jgi:hypothetical protein